MAWGFLTDCDQYTQPSLLHTFEAVADSCVSESAVSAPAISRVMGGALQSEIKIAKKIGEMTFGH